MACPVCNSRKTTGGGCSPYNFSVICQNCGAVFGRKDNVPYINGTSYVNEKEAEAAYSKASKNK